MNHELDFSRITFNPEVLGGKPCIRGMRISVDTIVGLVGCGHSFQEILEAYPYLEEENSYLRKLLENARIVCFLSQYHREILFEFPKLFEAKHLHDNAGT